MPKGGVGKSTSCAALAGALVKRGAPVHVIDLDRTRTLHRWYNRFKPDMPGFRVETVDESEFMAHIRSVYPTHRWFILIDVASAFAKAMVQAATLAHLTISPTKLSEPDIVEATKLNRELRDLSATIGKPIPHRLLINEVSTLFPTYQRAALADIARCGVERFEAIVQQHGRDNTIFEPTMRLTVKSGCWTPTREGGTVRGIPTNKRSMRARLWRFGLPV